MPPSERRRRQKWMMAPVHALWIGLCLAIAYIVVANWHSGGWVVALYVGAGLACWAFWTIWERAGDRILGGAPAPSASDPRGHPALGYIVDCRNGPSDYAFFWGPNGAGYTSNLNEAGLYTHAEYERRAGHAPATHAWIPRERVALVERRCAPFVDLGVGYEWKRREDIKTEEQAETLMAVMPVG